MKPEAEYLIAGEAFYKALIGEANYVRWQRIKEENRFTSEIEFVDWMLNIVESYHKLHMDCESVANESFIVTELQEDCKKIEECGEDNTDGCNASIGKNKRKMVQPVQINSSQLYPAKCGLENTEPSLIIDYGNRDGCEQEQGNGDLVVNHSEKNLLETGDNNNDDEELDNCLIGDGIDFMPGTNKVGCSICCTVCDNGTELLKHIYDTHSDIMISKKELILNALMKKSQDDTLSCAVCGKYVIIRKNLVQHIKSIHLGWRCRCELCNKEFTSNRGLNRHKETVHLGIRKFQCPYCSDAFKRSHHLGRHISRIHHLQPEGDMNQESRVVLLDDFTNDALSAESGDGLFFANSLSDDEDSLDDSAIPSLHDISDCQHAITD